MEPVIYARGLVKKFGNFVAVDAVDFSVHKGECFGILGPNGAGKTSIIRMISCLSPVTQGDLLVDGKSVQREPRSIKAILGVVPQEETLDPGLTVMENLIAYVRYFGIPKEVARKRARENLAMFQLLDRKDSFIDTLSGGMKRRLLIARALLNHPKLLVLDEPTTGLDPQARHMVWDKLRLLKSQGITMILSTHYMDEAYYLCDRLVIMDLGKVLVEGRPRDLVERYVGREVTELHLSSDTRQAVLARLRAWGLPNEDAGDTIYVFTENGRTLGQELGLEDVQIIHRNANLEDVFLRLTGHALREG